MMKKQGFTLAEVLITLTIIGVIATMTLPALMTNTQEQQAKTGLKKGVNTLTEAAQMHEAIEGFNYASLTDKSDVANLTTITAATKTDAGENTIKSLAGMLRERTKVDIQKTMDAATDGASNITVGSSDGSPLSTEQVIYFNDGTALIFDPETAYTKGAVSYDVNDGLPVGYTVVFDTNGKKGPNQLSNCQGKATGGRDGTVTTDNPQTNEDETDFTAADIKTCETKSKRVIKDQFTLKLRGNMVEPEGAAAIWAFGL